MDQKVKSFLNSKNESISSHYERAFNLFSQFTDQKKEKEITGSQLVKMIAEDRRKKVEEREHFEMTLLKEFFDWLLEEAPKKKGDGEGFSKNSAHLYLSGITEFLNFYDLPVDKKKLSLPSQNPKKENRKKNIRAKEIKKLVEHAKTNRDKALILCLWQSGMGVSELLSLDIGDVKLEDEVRGSLENPPLLLDLEREKTGVDYRTCFGADACKSLKRYLEERKRTQGDLSYDDPLFVQQRKRNGGYPELRKNAVDMVFKRLAKRSGIVSEERMENADMNPARPHSLRDGFSSVLKEEGMNQQIIDGFLGHSIPYDSAYHNFTDKQLRDIYQKYEEVLSIEGASLPKENEIKEVVKEQFGELGVEKIMPELKEKVEKQGSEVKTLQEEVEGLKEENRELAKVISRMVEPEICNECGEDMESLGGVSVKDENGNVLNRLNQFKCKNCNTVNLSYVGE